MHINASLYSIKQQSSPGLFVLKAKDLVSILPLQKVIHLNATLTDSLHVSFAKIGSSKYIYTLIYPRVILLIGSQYFDTIGMETRIETGDRRDIFDTPISARHARKYF